MYSSNKAAIATIIRFQNRILYVCRVWPIVRLITGVYIHAAQGLERMGRSSVQRKLSADNGRAQGRSDGARIRWRHNTHLCFEGWKCETLEAATRSEAVTISVLLLRQVSVRLPRRERDGVTGNR